MDELPLAFRSVPELRAAADVGRAYYSCERLEDAHGRLLVGVGARLTDRELDAVRRLGRPGITASPVALDDGPSLRRAVAGLLQEAAPAAEMHHADPGVGRLLDQLQSICPATASVAADAHPTPSDLDHGIRVAARAVRLTEAFNRLRESSAGGALLPYPRRLRQEIFAAGAVHDIGRWLGASETNHAECGADHLRSRPDAGSMEVKARMIGLHHSLPSLLRGPAYDPWVRHRALPLAMAEALMESDEPTGYIAGLADVESARVGKAMVLAACDVFCAVPQRSIVQLRGEVDELAVCLQAAPLRLLRFARRREEGDYLPLYRLGSDADRLQEFLVDGVEEGRVVAILEREDFERRFGKMVERL